MSKKSPDQIDIEVGRKVREARVLRGVSQTVLGDSLGISFQQIQKYEKGTNRIGSSRLCQIAEALQVKPADLLPQTDLAGEALPSYSTEQVRAAQIMGQIPASQRQTALNVLRQFVEG